MTTSIYGCCHWLDGSTRFAGRLPRIRAAFRDLDIKGSKLEADAILHGLTMAISAEQERRRKVCKECLSLDYAYRGR